MTAPRIVPAGDSMLLLELEPRIDPAVNQRAIGIAERMRAIAIPGVRDVVPTFRSVAVFFDPLRTRFDELMERFEQEAARDEPLPEHEQPPLTVPVCYGGELGPDLESVAKRVNLSPEDVVAIHSGAIYRVFMVGFLPGFAYMGLLDSRLQVPRHATPRVRVAKGSVGIAGRQTGIYPSDTPGGWQLLGRTSVTPFDIGRASPMLFKAGDTVRFVPVDRDEYERLARQVEALPGTTAPEAAAS
jgi:inhibitor of KinA